MTTPLSHPSLPEAPGAKASRTCGIIAILAAVTCIGFPVALTLAIIALVQASKARRLALEFPEEYQQPSGTGKVLGIVGLVLSLLVVPFMLPFVGVVSAVAIPALLQQRNQARQKSLQSSMDAQMNALVEAYAKGKETGQDQPAIHAAMEALLKEAKGPNPVDASVPAFRYTISIMSAATREDLQQQAEAEATAAPTGQIVFVVSYTSETQPGGYMAGAAALKGPGNSVTHVTHVESLD